MKRLTTDHPQENFETLLNYVFGKDGWAHIRHDGIHDNVPLTEWAVRQCFLRGCEEVPDGSTREVDEKLCDCMLDQPDCPVALAYCFASQAVHLRNRLKAIEDILGDEYDLDHLKELAQAEKNGRLVVFPDVQERDRKTFAEDLKELFDDLSNYDPSVGILGWSTGEAALASALMAVLTRKETGEALNHE